MAIFGAGTQMTYFNLSARTLSPAPRFQAELSGNWGRQARGPRRAAAGTRGAQRGCARPEPARLPERPPGAAVPDPRSSPPAPRLPPAGTRPAAPEPGEEGP